MGRIHRVNELIDGIEFCTVGNHKILGETTVIRKKLISIKTKEDFIESIGKLFSGQYDKIFIEEFHRRSDKIVVTTSYIELGAHDEDGDGINLKIKFDNYDDFKYCITEGIFNYNSITKILELK